MNQPAESLPSTGLRTGLQFPCDFPVKAMGRAGSGFELTVVELVRRHAPDLQDNPAGQPDCTAQPPEGCRAGIARHESAVTVRPSRNGRYLAVTVTVRATSREQLDAIYRELSSCEAVLMAL